MHFLAILTALALACTTLAAATCKTCTMVGDKRRVPCLRWSLVQVCTANVHGQCWNSIEECSDSYK
jgi:hypothetical protein